MRYYVAEYGLREVVALFFAIGKNERGPLFLGSTPKKLESEIVNEFRFWRDRSNMTIIKEYRIVLPITVEEYQVAQLYSVAESSKVSWHLVTFLG